MTWTLIFILSYSDPAASGVGAAYNEHATVTSPTYWSREECETAGRERFAQLNWSSPNGDQLRWVCTDKPLSSR